MPEYRPAASVVIEADPMSVGTRSKFGQSIRDVIYATRPRKLVETGTWLGTGTTAIIGQALNDFSLLDSTFYTIECNPHWFAKAHKNIVAASLPVTMLCGLSVPRSVLPTKNQIESEYVKRVEADGLFVDHDEAKRADLYFAETDFPNMQDDLLGRVLKEFDGRPDFVLLDSGGHMGHVEFQYLLTQLRGPCHVALDDVCHIKHHRSFERMRTDSRFRIVEASTEKFGFCVARFTPELKVAA